MNIYRIADLNIAYAPQSDYAAAFLAAYRTEEGTPDIVLSAYTAEEATEDMPRGAQEMIAVLRELAYRLPAHDRLLIHAATVVFDGRAYAFVAPSGTGKTTHVRLWCERFGERAVVLNGDRLFVRVSPDGVTAFGGPWKGKEGFGVNGAAPLAGIYILERGERSHCENMSPFEALSSLLRAIPRVAAKAERMQEITLLENLMAVVPLYRLYATPTVEAVDAVLEHLGGHV